MDNSVTVDYQTFDVQGFLKSVDEQASRQKAQSSSSILAEYSDLISSKDKVDAMDKHRERNEILARVELKPWGSGDVRYGFDGISLHDDATKGASRAGPCSTSSHMMRKSYEKRAEQNLQLTNDNYRLRNDMDEKVREIEMLRKQLEEVKNSQK